VAATHGIPRPPKEHHDPSRGRRTSSKSRLSGDRSSFLRPDRLQTSSQNTPPTGPVHHVSDRHFAGIDHLTPCQPHHRPTPSITRFESRSSSPTCSPDRILNTTEAKDNSPENMLCPYVTSPCPYVTSPT